MKTVIVAACALALASAGCDNNANPQNAPVPPDNTKTNERDRHASSLTPMDQGGNEIDRTITQRIRQDVMKDDSLSMNAKNIKIVTIDGVVTLRGPVKDDREKSLIATLAQQTGNVKRVDNQLEIAAN